MAYITCLKASKVKTTIGTTREVKGSMKYYTKVFSVVDGRGVELDQINVLVDGDSPRPIDTEEYQVTYAEVDLRVFFKITHDDPATGFVGGVDVVKIFSESMDDITTIFTNEQFKDIESNILEKITND